MNGRLYDPLVGRFLSPDNSVQNPYFTQNYNRYSYCLNNPLRFTDPSGNTYKPIYWDEAIGGGSSNGIIRTFGHFDFSGYNARADAYFAQGGYRYNATYGIYTNGLGQAVSWQTAVYGSFLNTGGFSEINDLNEYVYNGRGDYYGNGSYISNENGKYDIFVEVPEFQISLSAQGGGGWYDNAGVYITGAVLTAEDVYNNYYHNHATYFLKNGTERTILNERGVVRNSYLARNAANISTTVKVLGTTGSALMTAQAGTKIYNGNATAWDYGDFTVGSVGTVAGAAELIGGASYAVPGVGEAVAAYSWFRLWFDLGAQYGPSKWYGNDDTSWFK